MSFGCHEVRPVHTRSSVAFGTFAAPCTLHRCLFQGVSTRPPLTCPPEGVACSGRFAATCGPLQVWPLLLGTAFSRFIRVVAGVSAPLLFPAASYSAVQTGHVLLIPSSVGGCLGCFPRDRCCCEHRYSTCLNACSYSLGCTPSRGLEVITCNFPGPAASFPRQPHSPRLLG